MRLSRLFLTACAFAASIWQTKAQTIPCRNIILLTRQNPAASPQTFTSGVFFQANGSASVQNTDTILSKNLNGSAYYNGYIWAHDWTSSAANTRFQLLKIDSSGGTSVTPTSAPAISTTFNNATVDANGIMYLMLDLTLHRVDLTTATPTYLGTKTCTMSPIQNASGHIWGDLAVDPATGTIYAWYHPTSGSALQGLYTLTNVSGTTPTFNKVGSQSAAQSYTIGSLFFTDDGQLFGYGATTLGGTQDRLYAIDKATGLVTQYGAPDLGVSQSDGCSCPFRISLDKSPSIPVVNIQRCGTDTFQYFFKTRNYSGAIVNGITLRDTLDSRFYIAGSASGLQTTLQSTYGGSVSVSISSYGGGTNNLLTVTGMSLSAGMQSFSVPVGLRAESFSSQTIISQQAYLDGIGTNLGGPKEASDYPLSYEPGDKTPIIVNITGSRCVQPVADNFTSLPIPQGAGATNIPAPVGSDADGTIASYTIVTVPSGAHGTLSYCPNAPSGCTAGQYVSVSANTTLTPAQVATLSYDPVNTATGTGAFTFTVTDNTGNVSAAATYRLPVAAAPPVANNIMENVMANTASATAIIPLSGADADEPTLQYFRILSLPNAAHGTLTLCNPGCASVSVNQNIAPADAGSLRFDPLASFTGNASFTYTAVDNSGNIGNTATYTIPVAGAASFARPPLADNVMSQTLNNSAASTSIPSLRGSDLDGWVTGYTVLSLPSASAGTLYLCNPGCTSVSSNQSIAASDIDKLQFDPLSTFTGTASFTYRVTDNSSLQSNTATYTIPVINNPPTAANMAYTIPYNASNAALPSILGSDRDGSIASYTITSLPASGTLSFCNPGCNAVTLNQTIAVGDVAKLAYTPAANATGTFSFTYTSTDNNGNVSQAATYQLFVHNMPPVSQDIINSSLANSAAATAITALSASDADGTIAGYTIRTLPPASSGVLSLSGTPVAVNDVITPGQLANLQFDPTANYTGVTSFTYTSTDNSGNISNVSTHQIPITGVGNLPPIAKSIQVNTIAVSAGTTSITSLLGTDPDGIGQNTATFSIVEVPAAVRGTVKYCPLAPSSCTAGQMTTLAAGQTLTIGQAATLQFTPNSTYIGPFTFSYTTTDSQGAGSNLALYNIPVSGISPKAVPVAASVMSNTASTTAIPALSAADADGTITTYVIETIPPASQGVLYLCTPGCVAVTTDQTISAANAANLSFDPAAGYSGDVVFNYHALDNHIQRSNAAKYTIPVLATQPHSHDVLSQKMRNNLGATAIPALSATSGSSVSSYTINSIPPASQGVLYLCTPSCVAVTAGQTIAAANAGSLQFDPAAGFTGDAMFNYVATDATGTISNAATYVMPTGPSVALPVTGLDLSASLAGAYDANVIWHSESEADASHYDLERSTDGVSFERVTTAKAKGGIRPASYSYKDHVAGLNGTIYYRVRQSDINGAATYSKVVRLMLPDLSGAASLTAAPNPFAGELAGTIHAASPAEGLLVLSDVSGRVVASNAVQLEAGTNTYRIAASIAPGLYQLSLHMTGHATKTIKVVRQ